MEKFLAVKKFSTINTIAGIIVTIASDLKSSQQTVSHCVSKSWWSGSREIARSVVISILQHCVTIRHYSGYFVGADCPQLDENDSLEDTSWCEQIWQGMTSYTFVTDAQDLLRVIATIYTSNKINLFHSSIYNRRITSNIIYFSNFETFWGMPPKGSKGKKGKGKGKALVPPVLEPVDSEPA